MKQQVPPALFRDVIDALYPHEITHLLYDTARPWTFLMAVMLSAQCTDARVNMVTPQLFADFHDLESFVARPVEDIAQAIRSINFYKTKAKALKATAESLLLEHDGQVPDALNSLIQLRGVGRKTANVVLSVIHGRNEGFVVDTHIKRIAYRVGHTCQTTPTKVEPDLMRVHPQDRWGSLAHKMVQFGRDWCTARAPKCGTCPLRATCPRVGL